MKLMDTYVPTTYISDCNCCVTYMYPLVSGVLCHGPPLYVHSPPRGGGFYSLPGFDMMAVYLDSYHTQGGAGYMHTLLAPERPQEALCRYMLSPLTRRAAARIDRGTHAHTHSVHILSQAVKRYMRGRGLESEKHCGMWGGYSWAC